MYQDALSSHAAVGRGVAGCGVGDGFSGAEGGGVGGPIVVVEIVAAETRIVVRFLNAAARSALSAAAAMALSMESIVTASMFDATLSAAAFSATATV